MAASGKWIEGISAEAPVEEAARRSLEPRLSAVARWLPLAAHLAGHDVEHVHRLRVATRRASAALKLYSELVPRKPARWLSKRLRKIRQAAGSARDLDVLAARLSLHHEEHIDTILNVIRDDRARVQDHIVRIAARCTHEDRYVRKTAKLIGGIRGPSRANGAPHATSTFGEWGQMELTAVAAKFFDALPNESSSLASLHEFRIRAKALRYAIELVAPAFPSELRRSAYPLIESLQARLGEIQDAASARCRFEQWAADDSRANLRPLMAELVRSADDEVRNCVQEFHSWWSEEKINALRQILPHPAKFPRGENGEAATTESLQPADSQTQPAP